MIFMTVFIGYVEAGPIFFVDHSRLFFHPHQIATTFVIEYNIKLSIIDWKAFYLFLNVPNVSLVECF